MRHPRSLHRSLTHPPRSRSGGSATGPAPSRPRLPESRPSPDERAGSVLMSPAAHSRPAHPARRADVASKLDLAAWLTVVTAAVWLLAAMDSPPGLLVGGALLLAVPAIVGPPSIGRVVAALATLLLLPVLLLIAAAVRLSGRGPVLVREPGAGRGSPTLRFRTTAVADRNPESSTGGRLTRLGHVLRASCLDELPRLLDLVRGEVPLRHSYQR